MYKIDQNMLLSVDQMRCRRRKKRKLKRIRFYTITAALIAVFGTTVYMFGNAKQSFPILGAAPSNPVQTVSVPDMIPKGEEWELMLVNKSHSMPEGYQPKLTTIENGHKFDERAADALKSMLADARAEGLSPIICSSYRSNDKQVSLFQKQVKKQQNTGLSYNEAVTKAKTVVAYPGTSEHQLGLAVDIVAKSYQLLDDAQSKTAEAQWLRAHCAEYGFILRYPPDKSDITHVIFEPWHFRYVGVQAAKEIMERGVCLEEYLQVTD